MALYVRYSGQGNGGGGGGGSALTLAPVGNTPNADAATLVAGVLTLEPADGTFPGVLLPGDFNKLNAGNPLTFAGYDASGSLSSVPNWTFIVDGGSDSEITRVLPPDPVSVPQYVHQQYVDVTALQNNADYNYSTINFDIHRDAAGNNTDFTGEFNALRITDHIDGTGINGNHYGFRVDQNLGTGGTGSADNVAAHWSSATIGAGYTVSSYDLMYSFFENDGTITNDLRMINFDANGTVGGNFYGYSLNSNLNFSGNGTLVSVNQNGTSAQNLTFYNGNNTGAVTGSLFSVNVNNTGSTVGDAQGFSFFNTASVGGNLFLLNTGNNSGFTVTGGVFGVSAYNNADSDHVQMAQFSDNSSSTTYKNGLSVNLQGSAAQVTGAGIFIQTTSPQITAIQVDLSNATSTNQKQGLNINDGVLNVDSNWDTAILGNPGGVFSLNSLGGEFHISAGFPVTDGSFGFGNNIGVTILAEDDFPIDSSGVDLGFSINGFVDQIAVVSGKTFHTLNYMAAGGGIAPASTGGTITNLSMFRALGLLPEGGTLAITNMYGFKVDPLFDVIAASNEWGVWVGATNADNWFAKNVVIGGITGKPTGAYSLDVTGVVKIDDGTQANGFVFTSDAAGVGSWQAPSASSNQYLVDKFTLSPTDITNGFVTLAISPTTPADTSLTPIGGILQDYGTDYTVSGTTLSWTGLGLDGTLTAGDKLFVQSH